MFPELLWNYTLVLYLNKSIKWPKYSGNNKEIRRIVFENLKNCSDQDIFREKLRQQCAGLLKIKNYFANYFIIKNIKNTYKYL